MYFAQLPTQAVPRRGFVLLRVVGQSERGRLLMTRGGVVPNFAGLDSIHVFCTVHLIDEGDSLLLAVGFLRYLFT